MLKDGSLWAKTKQTKEGWVECCIVVNEVGTIILDQARLDTRSTATWKYSAGSLYWPDLHKMFLDACPWKLISYVLRTVLLLMLRWIFLETCFYARLRMQLITPHFGYQTVPLLYHACSTSCLLGCINSTTCCWALTINDYVNRSSTRETTGCFCCSKVVNTVSHRNSY